MSWRELKFDTAQLVRALNEIPDSAWSLASTYRDTGVHHGYRRVVLVSAGHWQTYADLFGFVFDAMSPVRDVTLSRLDDPGGFIAPHRDAGPWFERWQVPLVASGDWHGQDVRAEVGVAFPVQHWEPHAVTNRGPGPRIHLVIDRNIAVARDPLPFETFPVPDDMADLVDRSRQ